MKNPIVEFDKDFKEWLPNNNVKSVSTYFTYLRNACKATGSNSVDELLNEILETGIKAHLSYEKFDKDKDADDSRSAVAKYWDFLRHLGKDMESK